MSFSGPTRKNYLATDFSWTDYSFLSNDNFRRFKYSDPYIAYALVSYSSSGVPVVHEFDFPQNQHDRNLPALPAVKRLKHVYLGRDSEDEIIEATTVDNESMTTQRSIHFEMQYGNNKPNEYTLYFFSPRADSTESQNLSWESLNQYPDCEGLIEGMEIRGGEIDIVNGRSYSDDSSSSNSNEFSRPYFAMGGRAIDAYVDFQDQNQEILSDEMNRILDKSIANYDPRGKTMASFKRPEWCHALGKQFFARDENPNEACNLAAAPLWMNSQMMIFEESLAWHAQKYPQANVNLNSQFQVFDNSDVVYIGEMEGIVKRGNRTVFMHQFLLPHQLYPAYPQATDIAITTFVLNGLLLGKPLNEIDCTVSQIEQPSPVADASTATTSASTTMVKPNYFDEGLSDAALIELGEGVDEAQSKPILRSYSAKRSISEVGLAETLNDDEVNGLFDECEERKWKLKR